MAGGFLSLLSMHPIFATHALRTPRIRPVVELLLAGERAVVRGHAPVALPAPCQLLFVDLGQRELRPEILTSLGEGEGAEEGLGLLCPWLNIDFPLWLYHVRGITVMSGR